MLLAPCIACRYGHHERHIEHYKSAPPGMLGGASCPCKGECVGRRAPEVQAVDRALGLLSSSPKEKP